MKIEVEHRVWFTENIFQRNDGLCNGKVVKGGHKYIYVKGPYREFKFDKETLRQDPLEGTYGQLYLKEEDYQNLMELRTNIASKNTASSGGSQNNAGDARELALLTKVPTLVWGILFFIQSLLFFVKGTLFLWKSV